MGMLQTEGLYPSQTFVLKLNLQRDGIWGWGLREVIWISRDSPWTDQATQRGHL